VRVRILGPVELTDAAGNLVDLRGARVRVLLTRLAIEPGRTVPADRLAEDLWPAEGPADAANALQALVSRLRQVTGRDVISYQSGGYRLMLDPGDVDAGVFERALGAGRAALADGDTARGAALLREALALWRGDALADAANLPFAAGPASRLEEARLAATEDAIDAELELGRGQQLVAEVSELATANPLRERLRGQLMRALQAAGRQADALQAYEDIRHELADRLGVDPSPALAAVHLAIVRGEPSHAGNGAAGPGQGGTPAARVAGRTSGHLPARLTSFVGREDELRTLGKLLGEARLVTLTGPGGTGKTRLAIEAAAQFAGQLADGASFVALASVRDALDVPQAVLTAVAAPEPALMEAVYVPPLDRLTDVLAARELLLVLDNCEHVVDEVAVLAERVLAAAPGVRIIATSREPLAITGETLCPVPALALPPDRPVAGGTVAGRPVAGGTVPGGTVAGGTVPGGTVAGGTVADHTAAEDALAYAAVRLLADRAAAVRPGFEVDAGNAADVVRICRGLDGMPLAIELAAARLRVLTPAQVAERLDDRFQLLAVGNRTSLPRHHTLRAVVDWSWDLLDEPERTVLRRLSVFSGGAAPEAAEHVCAFGGPPVPEFIDVVASLVDKSLVTAAGDQEVRYALLETVRAYAAERLAEAGERDAVAAVHARYFMDLAEHAEPRLRAQEQRTWTTRLAAEHDNCSAALRHAVDTGDAPLGLRLVTALSWFWILNDYDAEAAQWADAVSRLAGDEPPPGLAECYAVCRILAVASRLNPGGTAHGSPGQDSAGKGSAGQGRADDEPARQGGGIAALAAEIPRLTSLVPADASHPLLTLVGPLSLFFTGDPEAASRELARLGEQHRDPWVRAACQAIGGHLAMGYGQVDTAAASLTAAHAAFREIGDGWGLVVALGGLAEVALAHDDPAAAVTALEEARGYALEGFNTHWGEMMLMPLGKARAMLGDMEGARADLQRGIEFAGRFGERDDQAAGYLELSDLARRSGDLAEARQLLDRARDVAESRPGRPDMILVTARTFGKLGCLAEQEGDLQAAARWHRQAVRTLADSDVPFIPVNAALAEAVAGAAALAGTEGDHLRAAELLGLARSLRGFRDTASLEEARATAAATAALGEREFAAAYERGRQLTKDDALALAR
jgi:predicted ATPase/DNA-binding SARP family transcriptional activator